MKISEMKKIIKKIFFDFEIIASEFVAFDMLLIRENTYHLVSIC